MRPFLILVLLLTLMGSVLVYRMLADNYQGAFSPSRTAEPAAETDLHSRRGYGDQLEAEFIRNYTLPDDGRHHPMHLDPAEHTRSSSSSVKWE